MSEEKPKLSMIERMKLQAENQTTLAGDFINTPANLETVDCPNCGAARAKYKGVTKCAYCNFEFISTPLDNGINIKSTDNSK